MQAIVSLGHACRPVLSLVQPPFRDGGAQCDGWIAMALLLDDPTACSDVPIAKPVQEGRALDVAALIERWDLEPADFQVRRHELCDCAGFIPGNLLVTVANRRVRTSRTYLGRLHSDEWIRDFEQDLRAGVFSGVRRC